MGLNSLIRGNLGFTQTMGKYHSYPEEPELYNRMEAPRATLYLRAELTPGKWLPGRILAMNLGQANIAPLLHCVSLQGTGETTQG